MMKRNNPLKEKSFEFSVRMVSTYQFLVNDRKEYVMSKQLLRSATAIGTIYREAEYAESKVDFIHKLAIAQKEANETLYWLELLYKTQYLSLSQFENLYKDGEELLKLITSIIKTIKSNIKN